MLSHVEEDRKPVGMVCFIKPATTAEKIKSWKVRQSFGSLPKKQNLFFSRRKATILSHIPRSGSDFLHSGPDSERVAGLNRESEKDKEKNKEAFRIIQSHTWNCRCVLRANARHYVFFVVEPHA